MESALRKDADGERDALRGALERLGRGESSALKEVYDRTSAKLFGICLRILRNRTDAEDVLQEVYVAVWRHSNTYDAARGSPVTWMATIAQRRCIDRLRTSRPGRSLPVETALDVVDTAPNALAGVVKRQDTARLNLCIEQLQGARRDAIRAAFLDGCTYEALALSAGVPLGTMKSWIRRSLSQLRVCLDR